MIQWYIILHSYSTSEVTFSSLSSENASTMIPRTIFRPIVVTMMKKVKSKKTALIAALLKFIGKSAVLKIFYASSINFVFNILLLTDPKVSSRPYSNTLIKHWKRERQNRTFSPGISGSGSWKSLGNKANVPTLYIYKTTRPSAPTRSKAPPMQWKIF